MMRVLKPIVFVLPAIGLIANGCMSDKAARELSDSISAGFATLLRSVAPTQDLSYATASFARKNHRWPNDYAELTNFVNQSTGYLHLNPYDRVQFARTPENDLVIEYVIRGWTNFIAFSHKEMPAK